MNCKQCGAPLIVEERRNYFHCQYCGGYEFPEPDLDGVALLDEISPFACPLCTSSLVSAAILDVCIDSCPNCRGNLIHQSKMLPILRQVRPLEAALEEQDLPANPSELTRGLACPSCQKPMSAYPYGGPGNILIQGCADCQLIWLDYGELGRILRSYARLYRHPADERGAKRLSVGF
jgi:Zn-finger nucleic acid-binding protein